MENDYRTVRDIYDHHFHSLKATQLNEGLKDFKEVVQGYVREQENMFEVNFYPVFLFTEICARFKMPFYISSVSGSSVL